MDVAERGGGRDGTCHHGGGGGDRVERVVEPGDVVGGELEDGRDGEEHDRWTGFDPGEGRGGVDVIKLRGKRGGEEWEKDAKAACGGECDPGGDGEEGGHGAAPLRQDARRFLPMR